MGFADLPPFKDPPTRPLAHDVKRPQLQSPDRWSTEKIILKFITHYSTKEIHAKRSYFSRQIAQTNCTKLDLEVTIARKCCLEKTQVGNSYRKRNNS